MLMVRPMSLPLPFVKVASVPPRHQLIVIGEKPNRIKIEVRNGPRGPELKIKADQRIFKEQINDSQMYVWEG